MFDSPRWLTALTRIREHQRDTALQTLAQSVRAATEIHAAAASLGAELAHSGLCQTHAVSPKHVNVEQLRQWRADRDGLQAALEELHRRQIAADCDVHDAQSAVAAKASAVEVLQRLRSRLDAQHRVRLHQLDEQQRLETMLPSGDDGACSLQQRH